MLKPIGPRVLIKRLPEPKVESELILAPETVMEKPSRFAIVLAVGKLSEGAIQVGDTVILRDYSGAPCSTVLDGETLDAEIVMETDVLAIVEGM